MSNHIRIGTWNVERAAPTKIDSVLARLTAADANIWVLTETRDALSIAGSYNVVNSDLQPGTNESVRWVSIWSRFALLEGVTVRDTRRTAAALYATAQGKLLVYGTVLPWHSDPGPTNTAANWSEHHRVIPEQADEWKALVGRYFDAALCVAGDLNMNLGGKHYYGTALGRKLLEEGLSSAGLACVTHTERVPSGKLAEPHIDHVCLPHSWAERAQVVDAWPGTIDRERLSDHSAIVVEVRG